MRDAQRLSPESSTAGGADALDQLERDHRQVEQLFARASLSVGADRLAVLPAIVQALTVHADVEEQVVYPAIEAAVGGGAVLTERSLDDHGEIKELLARIDGIDADSAQLVDDLRALQLVVLAHATIEEGEVFPAYRSVATADDLATLTEAAEKARAAAPAAPPDAASTPLVSAVTAVRS